MYKTTRQQLKLLREHYPVGCLVQLVHMDDMQAPPVGTTGRVLFVDDIGTIHVAWSNGSTLGVVPGADMITTKRNF